MKVKNVIELLKNTYEDDEELMIDWVDRHQFDEFSKGEWHHLDVKTWDMAVSDIEQKDESMTDMDYVAESIDWANKWATNEVSEPST